MRKQNIDLSLLLATPIIRANILTRQDCQKIVKEINSAKFSDSLIFTKNNIDVLNKEIRKSQSVFFTNSLILKKINKKTNSFAKTYWNLDAKAEATFSQVALYKKNDFFDWHVDSAELTSYKKSSKTNRFLTVVVMLNSSTDYKGGDFSIRDPLGREHRFSDLSVGEGLIFPSIFPHKIHEIKAKKRLSLTVWAEGNGLVIK